jgi:hypothetical protein
MIVYYHYHCQLLNSTLNLHLFTSLACPPTHHRLSRLSTTTRTAMIMDMSMGMSMTILMRLGVDRPLNR